MLGSAVLLSSDCQNKGMIKDGYQAKKENRQLPDYTDTPIVALTAKAMLEDRQKCIDAGVSNYIIKPIDTDKLLSMIRVWL